MNPDIAFFRGCANGLLLAMPIWAIPLAWWWLA